MLPAKIQIAQLNENIALLNASAGNWQKAITYMAKAAEIYEKLNEKFYAALSIARIGQYHFELRSLDKALKYLTQAQKNFLQLLRQQAKKLEALLAYITTNEKLADIFIIYNEKQNALRLLLINVKLLKIYTKRYPHLKDLTIAYAVTFYKIGETIQTENQSTAFKFYLAYNQKIKQLLPTKDEEILFHYAISLGKIGEMLHQKANPKAFMIHTSNNLLSTIKHNDSGIPDISPVKFYAKTLKILKYLHKTNPQKFDYLLNIAATYLRLSAWYKHKNDLTKAKKLFSLWQNTVYELNKCSPNNQLLQVWQAIDFDRDL